MICGVALGASIAAILVAGWSWVEARSNRRVAERIADELERRLGG